MTVKANHVTALQTRMSRKKSGEGGWLLKLMLIALLLALVSAIVLPLLSMFKQAFVDSSGNPAGLANFAKYFQSQSLLQSLLNTITVSTTATAIAVPLAFGLAYVLTRTDIKGKSLFKALAMLPLFAPTMMHGIALTYLFGHQGLISTGLFGLLPFEWRIPLYGSTGIIISEVIYTFPQAFLILCAGLAVSDYRLYEAAESMGASGWRKLRTVTLPSVKYALLSAVVICFTLSFTDFGAPKVVGGQYNVLATDIFKQVVGQQNMPMGAVVGIVLTIPAIIAFVVDRMVTRKQQAYVTSKSVPYSVKRNRTRNALAYAYAIMLSAMVLLLMGAVVLASVVKKWPYDMSFTWSNFDFSKAAAGGFDPFWNSVEMAAWTAVIGTVITFLFAYLIENARVYKPIRQMAYFLSILPLALPGLVIGLSYIYFFNHPANPLHFVYGTMIILVLANIIHFYSVPFMTATATLKMMDKEFDSVSESMNVSKLRTFTRITVPLSLPAILEMAVYYFVNAMVTVSALIFLYASDLRLASVSIVSMDDAGDTAAAAAMSVLVVLLNIVVRILYEAGTARLRRRMSAWQKR
ncbi:putative 2-aminoethylphosphonate ABC transporter permease subunit [Paenibacillus alkaliterrae]|uniref:putative 2-aminoethylphosphonate ABC transporter permease subunit n=1 Tax=Paenibacillus alkaliterrae TaxID=320909 RepID=UPI001F484BE4|nr:putative 2-aminoethylphosphonate ABC transporter permease subunit [Paenibacillus alkaliterrae]MCF2938971.1 putative 2-aminoethylphosphonate ABC transporter permease subunit [Paenibacillus alkaliterrae]